MYLSSCGRVVKALDLKSNGLCPRRFEPCQLRPFWVKNLPNFWKMPPVGFEPTTPSLRDWCSTTELKRHGLCNRPSKCNNWKSDKTKFGDTGDWTRDISHAKRALYHWATSPPTSQGLHVVNWKLIDPARLAEWSKAWDLSSHNRKIAWVQTPHLADVVLIPYPRFCL